jgi:beta-lactamase regulating signal transducer with metallopeptidase domain
MSSWAPYFTGLATWGVRLYIVIVVVALAFLFWTWLRLQILLRSGENPSPEVTALFEDLCRETKIRHCGIRIIAGLSSPATAGWWRPQILLPAEVISRFELAELAHILRHELTHVRRRDYLWDVLASIACRLIFFHPAVWLAYRKLRWERELSCDETVVQASQEERLQYAECLAKLARNWYIAKTHVTEGIGFAASPSLLATRVHALLREPSSSSIFSRLSRACLSSTVVFLSVALLPAVGLTLYWSVPLTSPSASVQNASHARRTPAVHKTTQSRAPRIVVENVPAQPDLINNSGILSGLFAHSGTKPLPVLQAQLPTEFTTRNTRDSAASSHDSGAWRESPMPVASTPDWQTMATDTATSIASRIGQRGGETSGGQSGEQGNH